MSRIRGAVRGARDAGATLAARRSLRDADVCTGSPRGPIVSLTTFPARVGLAHLAIRSILKGLSRPSHIELVLATDEFPDRRLPRELCDLRDRGVNVRFVPGNDRSYKKLLPTLARYPDRVIVTADDDTIYPAPWLNELLVAHTTDPSAIIGHRGTEILGSRLTLRPYVTWPHAGPTSRSERILLTGVSGILYPPECLLPSALDVGLARQLCPTADDIWFKAMSLLAGTTVRALPFSEYPSVRTAQRTSLRQVNVTGGRNEEQFTTVMDHFDLWSLLG